MTRKKLSILLILVIIVLSCIMSLPMSAKTITKSVDMTNVSQNAKGDGFYWSNRYGEMSFSGVNIDTEEDYGFCLPSVDMTITLEGDNFIRASKAALVCSNSVSFKGNGTLTLIGGDYGLYVNCSNGKEVVEFNGGSYSIQGGTAGIYSKNNTIKGGKCNITFKCPNYAIDAYSLSFNYINIDGTGSIFASNELTISDATMNLSASNAVLSGGNSKFALSSMSMKAGASLDSLTDIEEYDGQYAISTKGTADHSKKSILFGSNVSVAVDYVILIVAILLISFVVFFKIYRTKKKNEEKKKEIEKIRKSHGGRLEL